MIAYLNKLSNNEEKYFPFIKCHFLQPKLLKRNFLFTFLSLAYKFIKTHQTDYCMQTSDWLSPET